MSVVVESDETIALPELFEDGEYRLEDHGDHGWMGFVHDGKGYLFVDTREGAPRWLQRTRVGPQAVREAIKRDVTSGGVDGR